MSLSPAAFSLHASIYTSVKSVVKMKMEDLGELGGASRCSLQTQCFDTVGWATGRANPDVSLLMVL